MELKITFRKMEIVEATRVDIPGIAELAEEIARDSTQELMQHYASDATFHTTMEKYNMGELIKFFSQTVTPGQKKINSELVRGIDKKMLFTPYGKLVFPFTESAAAFVDSAEAERAANPRNTYRLIAKETATGKVIGGFVIDTFPDSYADNGKIGDIGIFFKKNTRLSNVTKTIYSIYKIMDEVIIDKHIIDIHSGDGRILEKNRLIVDATAHPLNVNSIKLLQDFCFEETEGNCKEKPEYGEYNSRKSFQTSYYKIREKISTLKSITKIEKECKIYADGILYFSL